MNAEKLGSKQLWMQKIFEKGRAFEGPAVLFSASNNTQ
jgi:hypothetical protein